MSTNVYVDGPRLHDAALKNRPYRWLDLTTWVQRLLPDLDVQRVRYFTAWADPAINRGVADRQHVYLRALATDPKVSLHVGRSVRELDEVPDAGRPHGLGKVVTVRVKGVDVALTTALFADIFDGVCDTAVLVTSDADLRPAIDLARRQGVRVGIVNPDRGRVGTSLRKHADFVVRPVPTSYGEAQLPTGLLDVHGGVQRAPAWATSA